MTAALALAALFVIAGLILATVGRLAIRVDQRIADNDFDAHVDEAHAVVEPARHLRSVQ